MKDPHAYRDISLAEEAAGCLLCSPAPCTSACPHGVPVDRIIRAIRFDNLSGAAYRVEAGVPCATCTTRACMEACPKARINRPVPIDALLGRVAHCAPDLRLPIGGVSTAAIAVAADAVTPDAVTPDAAIPDAVTPDAAPAAPMQPVWKAPRDTMPVRHPSVASGVDLSIEFCGLTCENPFFLSSSVVCSNEEMTARAFDMGWAGAAFKTIGLFVPEEVSPRFDALRKESVPFVGFKNIEQISDHPLEANLGFLWRLKRAYPGKILIASIMGRTEAEWTTLARLVTEAGADIIECNFSCPHMAADGLGSDVGQNPALVAAYTAAVRRGSPLPVLAKMTPNTGNMEPAACAAVAAGATGLAAINTIKSILNVDLRSFSSGPDVRSRSSVGGYSGKAVKPIALRFIHSLAASPELAGVPISGMGGIETWRDAAEFIAMGCRNIQITTAVMQYGYRIIDDLLEGMALYLAESGFRRLDDLVGQALAKIVPAEALDRASISFPRFDRTTCVGCGRCVISCRDGGHQALHHHPDSRRPILDAARCVGCQLCAVVCPAQAIAQGPRTTKKTRSPLEVRQSSTEAVPAYAG